MKLLTEYLSTKVNISNNKKLNEETTECIIDVIKSAFISILTTKCYKESSTFQKTIYRSEIDYELIKQNLEEEFNYYVDLSEIQNKGIVKNIVKKYIKFIEALINYRSIVLKDDKEKDKRIIISGRELFQTYKEKIYKK